METITTSNAIPVSDGISSTEAEPKFVIVIGASAGGMEDMNTFFDHTPLDGVAYVIVQHLSPDFKSRMAELLSKHSKLVVTEAEEGQVIKTNHVYTIPNNKYMVIADGKLKLTNKGKIQGPHLTINRFFQSLAAECGKKAIAIIFSGLGSDGTEGVKAIKKAGGIVIVRTPETTEFGSMPANAIATGVVDFILEPELIPEAIEDYVKNGGDLLSDKSTDVQDVDTILGLIKAQLPLDFSEYKQTTILRRIKRRAAYNNFIRLGSYIDFLKNTPSEIESLSKDFLISVTAFFRDPEAFNCIQKDIIPKMLKTIGPDEEIKLWVAGCATGEEAYSLAIIVAEELAAAGKENPIKIFATDIDSVALAFAGKGVYNSSTVQNVPASFLEKYFTKEGNGYKVNAGIRKTVIFAKHDLVKNPPFCNMDFISCRNLLIYMSPVLQKKIFLMMLFGLKKGGYLFLGSSENPMSILENLEVVNKKWKIYRNLEANRVVRFDAFSLPELYSQPAVGKAPREDAGNMSLTEAVNNTLCAGTDQLAVCINSSKQVIKTYGDTKKYLLQQNFNNNLTELLPRPLAIAFNSVFTTCCKTNEKLSLSGIKMRKDDEVSKVTLNVSPLTVKQKDQSLYLVTFSDDKAEKEADHTQGILDDKMYFDQYVINLEDEVRLLKDELLAAHEKLDATNENMQSFNEELLSANEEMQSTNEEMQSVNEELHTINADYQLKNKELLELNDDLNNYFRSNVNGQLFVNHELRLMKFSPSTVQHINLNETDIGRPLAHLTTNLKLDTLLDDLRQVITDGITITKDIESTDDLWYHVMTMPYIRNGSTVVGGAIITFVNVSELKETQQELKKLLAKREEFMAIASHELRTPLTVLLSIIQLMQATEGQKQSVQYTHFLKRSKEQIDKLRELINTLLDVTRIDSGQLGLNMTAFSINQLIADTVKFLGPANPHHPIRYKREQEIQLVADKGKIEQVLINLLNNAIKYSAKGTEISVQTKQYSHFVNISITDHGVGIAKEQIPQMFDRFFRADTKNMNTSGLGLGLYIVDEIIKKHKGTINVDSKLGEGTTITISLPRH